MASRDEILGALRRNAPPPAALPEARTFPFEGDLRERFARSVVEVGGRCVAVPSLDALPAALAGIPEYAAARRIVSLLPGSPALEGDPHDFEDVDFCVLAGELGVAENGGVWVTRHGGEQRSVAFLAQHIAVVVRAETLVPTLHEAYQRIRIVRPGFAMFLSGPSKTADIEQALVIGAHGPRSSTTLLVG